MPTSLPEDNIPEGMKVINGKVVRVQSTHFIGTKKEHAGAYVFVTVHVDVPVQYLFMQDRETNQERVFADVGSRPIPLGDARVVYKPAQDSVPASELIKVFNDELNDYFGQKPITIDGIVSEFEHSITLGRGV